MMAQAERLDLLPEAHAFRLRHHRPPYHLIAKVEVCRHQQYRSKFFHAIITRALLYHHICCVKPPVGDSSYRIIAYNIYS
jgi:hypothetical protein